MAAVLILIMTATILQAAVLQKAFNRQRFYTVIQQENLDEINTELQTIQTASFDGKEAFAGALMMKKAGTIRGASAKLKLFKKGGKQLDAAIKKEPDNAEYRFLRLIIQEHAPKIVNYKDDISSDKQIIVSSYKKISSELQKVISNYSTTSKALDPKDF